MPGFQIPSYPNLTAFQEDVAEKYDQTYGELVPEPSGSGEVRGGKGGLGRQVWHTPTELFRVSSIRHDRYFEHHQANRCCCDSPVVVYSLITPGSSQNPC